MNIKLLIDAIIRQTTVLIAHLATSAGLRAPLAHVANQVFLELVGELEAQGLGRKVIADMFGLALRSYQVKVRRLSESSTEQNRTLWEAVLAHIQAQGPTTRAQVFKHFKRDDEASVRGILHDLVESGLVFRAGRGYGTTYRAASEEELGVTFAADPDRAAEALAWIAIYRQGPLTQRQLADDFGMAPPLAQLALQRLLADGRIERLDPDSDEPRYASQRCVLPMGEPSGWEAAVFDHYQSMVAALCTKLRAGDTCAFPQDVIGGSTYSFDVWKGHPCEERVYGLLRAQRAQISALREEVTRHNQDHARPPQGVHKVVFYLGQNIIRDEEPGQDTEGTP
jgi:hypothetical protein